MLAPPTRPTRKKIYVNPKQAALLKSRPRRKAFLGGRGSGKTTVAGYYSADCLASLPRGRFGLLGLTYNQIQSIFLPPMIHAWDNRGFIEHIDDRRPGHYVIGKKPPSHWQQPYQRVTFFENQITFFNGFTISMLSFDRSDRNRGGNYDGMIIDEAVLISKDRYDKEIKPMIRGNIYKYPDNAYHHTELLLSSQSWTASGDWFPDLEFEAAANPEKVFFIEGNAYDNIDVLGHRYIQDLQIDLPLAIFQVEVLNQRRKKLPNSFYDEFAEDKHCYFNSYAYDYNESGLILTKSDGTDYERDLPLEVIFDFNAAFNSCIVGQEVRKGSRLEARVINNFWVKNKTFVKLVDQVASHYKGHNNKLLIWGDRNGNNKQANSEETYYQQIEKAFKDAGFTTQLMVKDRLDPYHALKHHVINVLLSEQNPSLPVIRLNQNKCKPTIVSIQSTPVLPGFEKDKSSERDKFLPQEKATHLSDCFDNWIYPKYRHLIESTVHNYRAKVIGK